MFEMLGNWSFGDYFKKEAIAWSWELLTGIYKLPVDRLYVTVFEGDAKDKLAFDQESYDHWKAVIAEDRILRGNKKDNFWEMGDTGPCGPCSEIHIDLRSDEERKKVPGKDVVNTSHPQVIEIWNNVFMEFNRKADGSLEPSRHATSIPVWDSNAFAWRCRVRRRTTIQMSSSPRSSSSPHAAEFIMALQKNRYRHAGDVRPHPCDFLRHCRRTIALQ